MKYRKLIFSYIVFIFSMMIAIMVIGYSIIVGSFGTWQLIDFCLGDMQRKGIISIMPNKVHTISMLVGGLVGASFFGFLSGRWIKQWSWIKAPQPN